jgi:hypothetical protein
MSEFVFLGVGGVLAFAIDVLWPADVAKRIWLSSLRARAGVAAVAAWLAVVFSGGVLVGWTPQESLPGPYLVGANSRSVDWISVAAATWTADELGPDNRFAADLTNRHLLATYGDQYPVSQDDAPPTARIFLSPTFDGADLSILRRGRIRYLLVDRRLATARPLVAPYFESGEPEPPARGPIPAAWLKKFDGLAGVSRVYDNGEIRIYDLGGLLDATS